MSTLVLIHSVLAAVSLLLGVQLLKPHDPTPNIPHEQLISAKYIDEFVAYDFNHPANTSIPQPTRAPAPFLLTSIELSAVALSHVLKHVLVPHTAKAHDTSSSILLLSPLLVLSTVSHFVVWIPPMLSTGRPIIGLFLFAKLVLVLFLVKQTPPMRRFLAYPNSSNWGITLVTLLTIFGIHWLAFVPFTERNLLADSNLVMSLLSCLSVLGPWIIGNAVAVTKAHPFLIASQAMFASLLALGMSLMTESTHISTYSIQSFALFAFISFLASFSRIFLLGTSPIILVELLRDQLSLICAWLLEFSDTSSAGIKIMYLGLATALVFTPDIALLPVLFEEKEKYILSPATSHREFDDEDTRITLKSQLLARRRSQSQSFHGSYALIKLISLAAMAIGFYQVLVYPTESIPTVKSSPSPTRKKIPGTKHLHDAVPKNKIIKKVTAVLVYEDASGSRLEVSKTKQSRQFAIKGTSNSTFFEAAMPRQSQIPKRKWDAKKSPEPHARDLELSHIQIGVSSYAEAFSRTAFISETWGPQVQWTVFWGGEDDPTGMSGDRSYMMEAFKRMVGKYPVLMEGEPGTEESMNIKWFKMLPYLYEESGNSTRWFFLCDDDTLVFPDALLDLVRSISGDPLTTSLYVGSVSENNRQAEQWGRNMAFGGAGVLISRHLAARLYRKFTWCIDELPDTQADCLLRSCVVGVTEMDGLGRVSLTEVPAFNQLDLYQHADFEREFLSAKLSRVNPVTLHHPGIGPSLLVGMSNSQFAVYDFWHLVCKIPLNLRFRRFFVHLDDGRTAVVTFGLHVRVYQHRLYSIEHAVDWDSSIPRGQGFLGFQFLLEKSHSPNMYQKVRRKDFTDFWLLHHADNRLVFSNTAFNEQFVLGCKAQDSSAEILNLCASDLD